MERLRPHLMAGEGAEGGGLVGGIRVGEGVVDEAGAVQVVAVGDPHNAHDGMVLGIRPAPKTQTLL